MVGERKPKHDPLCSECGLITLVLLLYFALRRLTLVEESARGAQNELVRVLTKEKRDMLKK